MSSLLVGGVSISVAPGSADRSRIEVADRSRALDNTYRVGVNGTAKREWHFSTPPVLRGIANGYETVLNALVSRPCSGDLLGFPQNLVTYSEQLDMWTLSGGTVTADYASLPAPDGTISADGFNPPGGGYYAKSNLIAGDANGRTFTASAWLHSVAGSKTVVVGVLNQLDAPIISAPLVAGPNWTRVSVTGTPVSATTGYRMFLQEGDGNAIGWFNWGMQLEENDVAGEYVKTTSAPSALALINCYTMVTGRHMVKRSPDHLVVLDFSLMEA